MPSSIRPKGSIGSTRSSSNIAPMSERQQMALLMQMTSANVETGSRSPTSNNSRSRDRNERGETPLHLAAIKGDVDQVTRLLGLRSDPNVADFAGWTPLHEACNLGWHDVAYKLILAGANVNAKGLDNETPLHDAVNNCHQKLVKLLVEQGADIYAKNAKGKSPYDNAVPQIAAILLNPATPISESSGPSRLQPRLRDEKKLVDSNATTSNTSTTTSSSTSHSTLTGGKHKNSAANDDNAMDTKSSTGGVDVKSTTTTSSSTVTSVTTTSSNSNSASTTADDIYEFKSVKESDSPDHQGKSSASSSSDPLELDKDAVDPLSLTPVTTASGATVTPSSITLASSIIKSDEKDLTSTTTSNKRPFSEIDNSSSTTNTTTTTTDKDTTTDSSSTTTNSNTAPNSSSSTNSNSNSNSNSNTVGEEDTRRKKRKEDTSGATGDKPAGKDGKASAGGVARGTGSGGGATGKGATGKSVGATGGGSGKGSVAGGGSVTGTGKVATGGSASGGDRKSPVASPKTTTSGSTTSSTTPSTSEDNTTATTTTTTTSTSDTSPSSDSPPNTTTTTTDLKVPPLKIVIPQQSQTGEPEGGGAGPQSRNGKTGSRGERSHHHGALPYVVTTGGSGGTVVGVAGGVTGGSDGVLGVGGEKDGGSGGSGGTVSPTENMSGKGGGDDKKDGSGSNGSDDQRGHHQRVLRSSHRSGTQGSADRSSNNSSPQLQRSHSPSPNSSPAAPSIQSDTPATTTQSQTTTTSKSSDTQTQGSNSSDTEPSVTTTTTSTTSTPAPVELHPRKRKLKPNKEPVNTTPSESSETAAVSEVHPHEQPIMNCYQLFLNIRKQIDKRRKGLFPVQPKPPQGFKDYLMNRCSYVLSGTAPTTPNINYPTTLPQPMKDIFTEQEKERYRLRMQHVIEKEKLVLSVEQEILRVHGRAARALANQSLPFSVCTILRDEEVYNLITPEQEEKDRNARSRYNGRLFLSWLQDVDDKWEKIKEHMLLRHHNEAESLHAVQKMDWEWKMKELSLCDAKSTPNIDELHVPMVHVSDDFDLLPA